MNKHVSRLSVLLALMIAVCALFSGAALADEVTADPAVAAVVAQLEAIDSLQTMQDKRGEYTVSAAYSADSAAEHEAARAGYELYVSKMFSARKAAQAAYDALTAEQQAQIDSTLLAKLTDGLSTEWNDVGTFSVPTPVDNFIYFAPFGKQNGGYPAYELSQHTGGEMPLLIFMVDTTKYTGTWTPSGQYPNGNFDVVYCCDAVEPVSQNALYRRINLEDSDYYSDANAKRIRAIVQNSYPYVPISTMKANMISAGYNVSDLTTSDVISGVQFAIWRFANTDRTGYSTYEKTLDIGNNGLFNSYHDTSNESWDWWSTGSIYNTGLTYDADAEYRVHSVANYLYNLPGVEATESQLVISDFELLRSEPVTQDDNTYKLTMRVVLNNTLANEADNVTLTLSSGSKNTDGTDSITDTVSLKVPVGQTTFEMTINANYGDTIQVIMDGTQTVANGVYFYEPQGGRSASQTLVGMASGETLVHAESSFVFVKEFDSGIRIYKSNATTGEPLSGITFTAYRVPTTDGETIGQVPTEEEIAKYAVEANLVGSVTTDEFGYAALALEKALYLIVEEESTLVTAPVDPFYIVIPMMDSAEDDTLDIVAIYPKNTPATPSTPTTPPEPDVPQPESENGSFSILKYNALDESAVLSGAQFQVFRLATDSDSSFSTLTYNGVKYSVVPVTVDGSALLLITGADGTAASPTLPYGVYFLQETLAPTGYNLSEEIFCVEISAASPAVTVKVPNTPGTELPATGGMGVTLFHLFGSLTSLMAAALMIARRKFSR